MQCLSKAHRANRGHASLRSPKTKAVGIWGKGARLRRSGPFGGVRGPARFGPAGPGGGGAVRALRARGCPGSLQAPLRVRFSAYPTVLHQARQVCLSTDTEPKRERKNIFKKKKIKGQRPPKPPRSCTSGRAPPKSDLIGLRRPSLSVLVAVRADPPGQRPSLTSGRRGWGPSPERSTRCQSQSCC